MAALFKWKRREQEFDQLSLTAGFGLLKDLGKPGPSRSIGNLQIVSSSTEFDTGRQDARQPCFRFGEPEGCLDGLSGEGSLVVGVGDDDANGRF